MDGWFNPPTWCLPKMMLPQIFLGPDLTKKCAESELSIQEPHKICRKRSKKRLIEEKILLNLIFLGTLVFWNKCLQVCIEQGQTHSTSLSLLSFAVLFNIGFAPFAQARYHDVLCSCVDFAYEQWQDLERD
jgi:hypothetical protein